MPSEIRCRAERYDGPELTVDDPHLEAMRRHTPTRTLLIATDLGVDLRHYDGPRALQDNLDAIRDAIRDAR